MGHISRKFNCFVEGHSTHTEIEELTLPVVRDQLETIKAGGLLAEFEVPLGLQKLEAGMKLTSRQHAVMKFAGLTPGKFIRPTFRSVSIDEANGDQQDEVIVIQGRLNVDSSTLSAQSVSGIDYKWTSISYFKHTVAGKPTLYEIDLFNFICVVDGVDQWSDVRNALGL